MSKLKTELEADIKQFTLSAKTLESNLNFLEVELAKRLEAVIKPVLRDFRETSGLQVSAVDLIFEEYKVIFNSEPEYVFDSLKVNLAAREIL